MSINTKRKNAPVEIVNYKVDEKKSPFIVTEAFRNLMTNVGFAIPKKENGKGKVVCISSSVASEGKTTIAVNLALTCARSGAKTVLIDCDLRKPHVKHYFPDVSGKTGITSFLSGQASLEEAMVKNVVERLDIVFGIKPAPNPIVLLNGEAYALLIEKLEAEYDYVIIDTPPIGIVSDATILGRKSDGLIVVASHMYSNHRILKDVLEQLEFADCRILGFVLNKFPISQTGYGTRYNYRYGGKYGKYKYGYHYGSASGQSEKKEK